MARRKPGPKAQRRNPSPRPDEDDVVDGADGRPEYIRVPYAAMTAWVAVEQIDAAERVLRNDLKSRERELERGSGETMTAATARIAGLVVDVAQENEHLWWTPLLDFETEPIDVEKLYPLKREDDKTWTRSYRGQGDEPRRYYRITSRPQERQDATGVPTETLEWFIEEWVTESRSWKPLLRIPAKDATDAEWWLTGLRVSPTGRKDRPLPDFFGLVRPGAWIPTSPRLPKLKESVAYMLRGEMGRAGKEGKSAYLAYALLGALLDLTPLKIRQLLDNRRYPRPSRQRPRP